jgi:small subunit ribosomal protein S29
MSAPNCLRGLVRPSATIPISAPRTAGPHAAPIRLARPAPFSTTGLNARQQNPNQQGGGGKGHVRQGKKLKLGKFKKTAVESKGKPPLPGERKAYRKRITLSNDNAIPVPWLSDLGADDLANANNIARVLALPEEVQDQLRASEAFKPTQCWGMFRKPSLLVRKESVDLTNRIQTSVDNKQTMRLVVTGDKVTGKSMMLLQAQAHAFLNNWVVIHIPEGMSSPSRTIPLPARMRRN